MEDHLRIVVVEGLSAVNELLLSIKVGDSVILDHGVCFKSSNCGESPAASTMTLVLNWGDTRVFSPVPLRWNFSKSLNGIS